MFKTATVVMLILAVAVCCMGQTFQYSRGWTNGKRTDPRLGESAELILDADWEKKLEKCIYTLQRIIQIPYLRSVLMMASRKATGHHRTGSEVSDDFLGVEPSDPRLKRNTNGVTI